GAAAGLVDDQREVIVEGAGGDLAGGPGDGVGQGRVEAGQPLVDPGGGLLDEAEGVDDLGRHAGADGEVLHRPLGLGAPQPVGRDLHFAEAVPFGAHTRSYRGLGGLASPWTAGVGPAELALSYPLDKVIEPWPPSSESWSSTSRPPEPTSAGIR